MSSGAVRELITKVVFKIDKTSLNAVNKTIRELKQSLNSLSRGKNTIKIAANAASVNATLTSIRNRLTQNKFDIKVRINPASLNGAVEQIRNKIARRAVDIKVRINPTSLNNAIAQIKNRMAHLNLDINAHAGVATIRANVIHLHGVVHGGGSNAATSAVSGGVVGGAIGGGLKNFASSALGLATAYGGIVGTGEIISTADAMASLDGRIRNVTKSEQERLDIESQLYAMGQKTGASLRNLGNLYLSVASSSAELGFEQKDNLKVAETVSKALAVGGAGAQQASSAILQLGQALGSGVLQGEELNSLRESAPGLLREMAKYFKVSIGDLKKLGSEGKLTSKEVMNAIIFAGAEIDKQFAELPMTFGAAMTIMGNSWDRFIMKVEQKSTVFSTIAKGFAKAFEDLGNTFDDFATLMGTPDPNKMVTITEASTGETKQITEADYYAQKAAQNPQMAETIKQLREFADLLDRIDGKTGNINEQISEWVSTFLKIGVVLTPILVVLTAISAIITILTPIFSLLGTFLRFLWQIGQVLLTVWRFIYPAIQIVIGALAGLSATAIAVILGIIAVLALVIVYWDEICEAVNIAAETIMEACGKAADFLAEAFDTAIEKVKSFFDDLKNYALDVIDEIVDALGQWLGEKIAWGKQALADLTGFASNAADGVASTVSNAINNTQTNTYNLASAGQLAAATNSSNRFFAYN